MSGGITQIKIGSLASGSERVRAQPYDLHVRLIWYDSQNLTCKELDMEKLSLWESHRRDVREMLLDGHTHAAIGIETNRSRAAITMLVGAMRRDGSLVVENEHTHTHAPQVLGNGEL